MPPKRIERPDGPTISVVAFKEAAARLLPPTHPLNVVLRNVPESLSPAELAIRLDDWIPLLSVEA